jgi:hypothetical protein
MVLPTPTQQVSFYGGPLKFKITKFSRSLRSRIIISKHLKLKNRKIFSFGSLANNNHNPPGFLKRQSFVAQTKFFVHANDLWSGGSDFLSLVVWKDSPLLLRRKFLCTRTLCGLGRVIFLSIVVGWRVWLFWDLQIWVVGVFLNLAGGWCVFETLWGHYLTCGREKSLKIWNYSKLLFLSFNSCSCHLLWNIRLGICF